jgi:GntR family transcriptional regulator/MocR family aminotransferase
LPALRTAISRHLRVFRGIDCDPDQVFITSGNSDALQLIATAVSRGKKGRSVWVEDPGYVGARQVLAREGLTISPVPVDSDGLRIDVGRQVDPDPALVLVTPSRQFPLGMPLSLARRLELVRWSRAAGVVLVEDDYDCELRFSGWPIPSLITLDPEADVLCIGSLSKLTFSGLRLGYVVGPRRWIDRLAAIRAERGSPVATSAQPALSEYIENGLLAKHLRALRLKVGQSREALIALLRRDLADELEILPQHAGMHLTVMLAAPLRDIEIARNAAGANLHLDPLSLHYLKAEPRDGFVLGYSAWSDAELERGVEALKTLLKPH